MPTLSALDISTLLGQAYPPTAEQQAIIEAPPGPQLVVAGAGSGKTETMSARVVWLVANGIVEPRHVLGLTFTRKAAHELDERITARLDALTSAMRAHGMELPAGLAAGPGAFLTQRPHVHTYNGFALDLVKEHALRIGLDPEFTVLTPAAAWQIAYDIVDQHPSALPFTQKPSTVASAMVSLAGSLADHLVDVDTFDGYLADIETTTMNLPLQDEGKRRATPAAVKDLWARVEQRRALAPLVREFARRKKDLGAIDFADQVALAARIASTSNAVAEDLRAQYPIVLLDEFQDTSVGQLVFLSRLFGNGHPTCAVGDPQQAIYGWRGASAASLTTFADTFGSQDAPVSHYALSTSFRNDSLILDAANEIGSGLAHATAGISLPVLRPRQGAGHGRVRVSQYPDAVQEAQGIAQWIREERSAMAGPMDGEGVEVPTPTAAVLVRTRSLIPTITTALADAGLDYRVVGGGGLIHEPEVADVRALLEIADNSERGDALMHLIDGPRFQLGVRDIAVLGRWREQLQAFSPEAQERADTGALVTLVDTLEELPPEGWRDREGRSLSREGRDRLTELRECVRAVRSHSALELPDLVALAVRVLGVDTALLADPERDPAHALANLEEFRAHAAAYSASSAEAGLSAFLAFLEVTEEKEAGLTAADAGEAPEDAVVVSTMHASKGLEWDLVAIAGLADGTFPSFARRSARDRDEDGFMRPRDPGWLDAVAFASIPTGLRGDSDMLSELEWAEVDTQVELEAALDRYRVQSGAEKILEETRLMYVAVTRARESLLLTWSPWREGIGSPLEISRFARAVAKIPAVERQDCGEIPDENPLERTPKTAAWPAPEHRLAHVTAEAQQLMSGNVAPGSAKPAPAHLVAATDHVIATHRAGRNVRDVHVPLRLSPSDLVALGGNSRERVLDIVRPLPRRPSASAALGTRFHEWLEHSHTAPALIELDDWELELGHDEEDAEPRVSVADLRERFARSQFASMAPIAVEEPVTLSLSGAFMPGVIDAVYSNPDGSGVWIVDWKTGRVPHAAELDRKALQLSVYRLAWHQRTGIPLAQIRTFFHYVAAEKTVEITRHASAADLEQILAQASDDVA